MTENSSANIVVRVRGAIDDSKLTTQEVASRADVDHARLISDLDGSTEFSVPNMMAVATALGARASDWLAE